MLIYSHQVTDISTQITEPMKLAFAKDHLRVTTDDENILITGLITAARQYVEFFCARSFVQHTYRADLPYFYDVMDLPLGPVQSVTSIKYYDTASPSVLQTIDPAVYDLHHNRIIRNYGQSWESAAIRPDAVQVTYTAGYSDLASPEDTIANVPEPVRSAMLLLIGDLHEHRERQVLYPGQMLENLTFKMLLAAYRQYR